MMAWIGAEGFPLTIVVDKQGIVRHQRDEVRGTVSKDQRGRGRINAPTRTRQASPRCSNVRVVLFLYDEQQSPIPETIRPMLPNRMTGSWITLPTDALRIYFNLCIIKYFLNIISPNNDMKAKVDALLSTYPSIDITAMGFPREWPSEPLWQ